jgi:hypothetical protein
VTKKKESPSDMVSSCGRVSEYVGGFGVVSAYLEYQRSTTDLRASGNVYPHSFTLNSCLLHCWTSCVFEAEG